MTSADSNRKTQLSIVLPVRPLSHSLSVNLQPLRDFLHTHPSDHLTVYVTPETDVGLSYLRLANLVFSLIVRLNRPQADVVVRRRHTQTPASAPHPSPHALRENAAARPSDPTRADWHPVRAHSYHFGHSSRDLYDKYPTVAVGGTFDRLHAGHRLLLTAAAWAATGTLRLGITADVLLRNKQHRHLIASFERRSAAAVAYARRVKPTIPTVLVTSLTDPAGPTAYDPAIAALVVSKETLDGARNINAVRRASGLPPMAFIVVDVLDTKGVKLSSSALREQEAKRQSNGAPLPQRGMPDL